MKPTLTISFLLLTLTVTSAQEDQILILSERRRSDGQVTIRSIPADPQTYIHSGSVPSNLLFQQPTGKWTEIAADYNRDIIIWSDENLKLLWRGNVSQPQATPTFKGISYNIGGVAIDWMTGNVYWSDNNYNWIMILDTNGNSKVLIDTALEIPGGIAVYPERDFLYWTNRGTRPKIERSDLAGENRQLVATANVRSPHGIAIDYITERLYWTDTGGTTSTLESCDLNGNDRITEFSVPADQGIFHDVAIFQNYIYITDWTDALRCFLKDEKQQLFKLDLRAQPYGITIFAPQTSSTQTQNPCLSNQCEHICVSDGYNHFKCICRDGYNLHNDGTSCIKENIIAPPIVIVAFKTKICWYPGTFPDMSSLNSYTDDCLLYDQKFTAAITVDENERLLFFIDIQTKSINRVQLQNNASVVELIGARGSVEGLAVDWLAQNIYWTDNVKGHIAVSRYDGRHFKVLIEEGVLKPRSIAVDPHERILFWTQFGPPAGVSRANLDGTGEMTIVYNRLLYPSGLAIDYAKKRFYFADTGYGAIQVVDYNGENREIFTLRRGKQFFDLAIFRDYVLWTEWDESNGVHVLNKETKDMSNFRSHVMSNEERVYGIASFSKYRQRGGNGPCGVSNGGCSQLCLPSGPLGSYICSCSTGYHLHKDGTSCISEPVTDNFILLTDTYLHGLYQLDMSKQPPKLTALPLDGSAVAPLGIGYDPVEATVYWSDTQENAIIRAKLNGELKEVIIGGEGDPNIHKPHSLAVEPSARLMFWTDIAQHSIMVSRLDGTRRKTLVENVQYPRDIVLCPGRGAGYMFWSSWSNSASIERSFMDGTGRRLLANESVGWPYALTADKIANKLYWTDAQFHSIEVSDFLGLTRRTLLSLGESSHPFGIVIYDNRLYWSDWTNGRLSWIEIEDKYSDEESDIQVFDVEPVVLARPNYLTSFSKSAEVIGNNICIVNNGGCSGLCLPIGFGRTCACEDGMQLKDDLTTCMEDSNDILCPDELPNGSVSEGCLLTPGSRCFYQCDDGFQPMYPDVLCLSTGTWRQEQQAFCQEILCQEPDINTATVEKLNCIAPFAVNTNCVFGCISGFSMTGNGQETITCRSNGEWSGQPLECEEQTKDIEYSEESDILVITATPPQSGIGFKIKPQNVTLQIGETEVIQRCVANETFAEITWYKDDLKLPSDAVEGVFIMAGGQLFIPDIEEHHAGKYTCQARSIETLHVIKTDAYIAFQPDTIFQVTPEDATIDAGDDHVFQCATEDPTHIIEWEKDGTKITYTEILHKVPMTDNIFIRKAIGTDSGRYTCVVLSFDLIRIAEAFADLFVEPSENTEDICGTITEPEAVALRARDHEVRQESRIVNGSTSVPGGAPWMARLWSRSKRSNFCGGNLINRQWIVTAGHCIRELDIPTGDRIEDDLLIRLGDYDTMTHENSEELIGVSKIKLHHKFDFDNFDRDIALVKLSRPVEEFTDYIRPICLANATYGRELTRPGVKGLVVGWGRVAEGGHYARYMKEVSLPIRGRKTCASATKYLFSKFMFCAGNPKVEGDACEGDSGGPFAVLDRGRWNLVGLVSWGEGCAREGKYGYYTKVPKFVSWIQNQIRKHS
ncbi:low-density lipoprotein receptor-related protein 2-like [Amphiura filiformis]|uniref:low-density lipoprotein receptor-related protein 2-like n=1 Tax=Amphiura filiformis TaxID=82378 RepID=UPI003B20D367